jgi:hypothetical protein
MSRSYFHDEILKNCMELFLVVLLYSLSSAFRILEVYIISKRGLDSGIISIALV